MGQMLPPLTLSPIPTGPSEITVSLPGGAILNASAHQESGDLGAITRAFFGQVSTALAPLAPFFVILEVCTATLKCIQAVPESITGQPLKLVQATSDLVAAVGKLVPMVPQVSVPVMIKTFVAALLQALQGQLQTAAALSAAEARVVAAETLASSSGNAALGSVAAQARASQNAAVANMNKAVGAINRILALINSLAHLVGLPCVPTVGAVSSEDMTSPLLAAVSVLEALLAAIPVGIPALPAVPGPNDPC